MLYVTFKQKGGINAGPISAIVTLSGQGGLNAGVLKVNCYTNSNNYSFGNHFFKVLVQIPYS